MKALFFHEKLVYKKDYPCPERKEGEALIKVIIAGICNTDREIIKGYKKGYSGVLGHEFVGLVVEADNKALVGERVVSELNIYCGRCPMCKSGKTSHCYNRKVIGMVGKDGCFAQYITVSEHLLHVIPKDMDARCAVFAEPLAAAFEVTEDNHIKPSMEVGIVGDGRLAYMVANVVEKTGCRLTVLGKHEEKLRTFREISTSTVMVCENTINQRDLSFDMIIEASGSPTGMDLSKNLIRPKGTIIIKSTYATETNIDLSYFTVNEITVKGNRCGPFEPAIRLLSKLELPEIKLFSLDDFQEAFSYTGFKAGFDISKEK